jgi:tripartite-type tricarboxylate transporter receptor subunit TctC
VLAARADGPFTDLATVLSRARADPGGVSYATPGILSHLHVAMERFARLAGVELNHIPFQGTAPGVVAVLAGQVDLIAVPLATATDPAARLRPLAVATEAQLPELPGTPTFRGMGLDVTLVGWRGLFAPAATPPEVTGALERAVLDALADPDLTATLRRLGLTPAPLDAASFAAFWAADRAAMEAVVATLPRG